MKQVEIIELMDDLQLCQATLDCIVSRYFPFGGQKTDLLEIRDIARLEGARYLVDMAFDSLAQKYPAEYKKMLEAQE